MGSVDFPQLFSTDDYRKCIQNKRTFCMIDAKLRKGFGTWEEILEFQDSNWKLDRSYIHRGLCLPQNDGANITKQTTYLLNNELSNHNLTANVEMMFCQEGISEVTTIDRLILLLILSIAWAVVIGTIMEFKERKPESILEKILVKFSFRENLKKIMKHTGDDDFNRLKCIQGIRVLAMIGVGIVHGYMRVIFAYYQNPEEVEDVLAIPLVRLLSVLLVFYVHIFLTISGFLVVNQVCKQKEKNGSFTKRDVFALIINRYFRLSVITFLFVILSQTSVIDSVAGVPLLKLFKMNKIACEKNWAQTIFFFNNFMYTGDTCYFTAWYLSADFQAYVIVVLILYISFKKKLQVLKVMLQVLFLSIFVKAVYIYLNDPQTVIFRADLRGLHPMKFFKNDQLVVLYSSTIATLPTSFIGMIFGYIYFRTKELKVDFLNQLYKIAFKLLSIGLPLLSIYLATLTYDSLVTALIGSVIKAIFCIGIGTAILGISAGFGGNVKKFLEWTFLVVVGNITFCSYMVNYMIVILSSIGRSKLDTLTFPHLVVEITVEILVTMVCGIILTLCVELPSMSIQKMFLPQLSDSKNKELKTL